MDDPSLISALDALKRVDRYRTRRVLEGPQGPHVLVDGRRCIAFASNDYLGLANSAELSRVAALVIDSIGVGAGASHLLSGHHVLHQIAEHDLAKHVGMPDALLFSSGYMANIGVVTSLLARDDAIFADKLNHASLIDAALLSRAKHHRYRHGDLGHLEDLLRRSKARKKMVVTDAVFSMDGDIAPVPDLLRLAQRYDAWLYLDDAHGIGVLGHEGRGVLEHFGLLSQARNYPKLVYMATLGKAIGASGAFVAGSPELMAWLVNKARTYIYTTAMPPMLAAVVSASLNIVSRESWRRERLASHARRLRDACATIGLGLMASETAIQPLMLGSDSATMDASNKLMRRGVYVPAIRNPTVPLGTARLRISLSAGHEDQDIDELITALQDI